MQVHIFITLASGAMFHKARPPSLNLDSAASFLLDMLHISTTMAYNLSSQVEARDGLEVDRNLLLGPFALAVLVSGQQKARIVVAVVYTYSTILISLNLFRFASP